MAENINEVFWITDPAKKQILYVSPAYEAIWGRFCASVLESPRAWLEAIHPEDRDRVLEAALTKQLRGEYDETYRIIRPDASVRWVHDRAFPIRDAAGQVYRIVGVAADITNQRNLEQQLRHIQKMESIGQLAAGVAHDFNNVLAVIRGNAELALMDAGDSPGELADFLQQITAASDRAAHLTRQLLMFARKQVVQLHVIDVSEAGHGATFRLYLPVAGTVAKDEAQRVAEPQVAGGKETILLVEDDAAVRALMRNVLERYGYTVIEAESGVKALKVWETQGDQIALLLTDMVMPDGITGRALAQKLHSLKPTLPVIYTSGYSAAVVAKGFELKEGANFLQKPCAPRMLALAVRQCLDRPAAQSDTTSGAES